jgi:hypothetical protein
MVEGFDGHEVSLNAPSIKLERFKGGSAEGLSEIR